MHATELARRFSRVKVDPRVLYVDEGQILTSAGTAPGIDLCLRVVRCDHGAEVANAVARRMVVPPHRHGGQAQFVDLPVPRPRATTPSPTPSRGCSSAWTSAAGRPTGPSHGHEPPHLRPPLPGAQGTTPHRWILGQRVLAQRLVETTDDPVALVAARRGFATAAGLGMHFQRELGASPLTYRHTFRRTAHAG